MKGSLPVADPIAAGIVKKPLSADGSNFVFGSKQQFEPAGNSSGGDVSLYQRDLQTDATQVVSTLPDGSTIEAGDDVAELDISSDGSRVLIGQLLNTDEAGNRYWHLYMHVGVSTHSVDLTPGTTTGVLYDGMTADGGMVYLTTSEPLASDTDTSADLYRADVGSSSATLTRVSTGTAGTGDTDACDPAGNSYNSSDWNVIPGGPTDCSVVAVGGGGGVAPESGRVYFLSPEQLDGPGNGVATGANLYVATPGSAPHFVATLESGASTPLRAGAHPFIGKFGAFARPEGAAIDHSDGSIYAYDATNALLEPAAFVQKFDASGNPVTSFGTESKSGGFMTLGGAAGAFTTVGIPTSIAVDNNPASPNYRDVFVLDSFEGIKKLDPSTGSVLQIIPAAAPFSTFVASLALNPANGWIYVGITNLFGPSVTKVQVFDATGVKQNEFSVTGKPYGVAVDSTGRVYVANGLSAARYSATGVFEETIDSNPAYGVAVDRETDHLYVDEGFQVREYDETGEQLGEPFGSGHISESVSLGVDAGKVVVSDAGSEKVATFGPAVTPPDRGYDNPLVIDSVRSAETRSPDEFQLTPSGEFAAFFSTLPLTGFQAAQHFEVFRYYATGDALDCVSCNSTEVEPTSDSALAKHGLSLTDDGRVFFNSGESLVMRDSNSRQDAYEWKTGKVELISTGQSGFNAGLLSVTADGTDAFFFTRDTLVVKGDDNGSLMKLYDARSDGGFFIVPEPPQCAASDECHGPGSKAAAAPLVGTVTGQGGNQPAAKRPRCKSGFVRRHGRCVRKKARRQHRGRKRGRHG
jgi:hypothetical protein